MKIIQHIILIAFIIRLALPIFAFLASPVRENFYIHYDSEHYIAIAKEIAQNGRFYLSNKPQLYRTPGYPLFLVLGVLSGNIEWTTIFLQIIISCTTIYLVYKISLIIFNNSTIACSSALLYTFEPLSILYCSRIMSETLFTFLTYAFLYLSLCYFKHGFKKYLLLSSVALAFAIYVRTVLYYFPIALLITAIIYTMLDWKQRKKHLLAFGSFFGIIIMLVGAWHVRNGLQTGYWGFSIIGDSALFLFHGSSVIVEKEKVPLSEAQKQMAEYYSSRHQKQNYTIAQYYKSHRQEGIRIIVDNPFFFLEAYTKGLLKLMFDPGTGDYLSLFHYKEQNAKLVYISINKNYFHAIAVLAKNSLWLFMCYLILFLILLFHLAFAGCAVFLKNFKCNTGIALLFITAIYIFLVSGGVIGTARYRHPIMPALSILAGYSLHALLLKMHEFHNEAPIPHPLPPRLTGCSNSDIVMK